MRREQETRVFQSVHSIYTTTVRAAIKALIPNKVPLAFPFTPVLLLALTRESSMLPSHVAAAPFFSRALPCRRFY